jgi:uncharacterized protein (DUF983 family)
MLRRGLFRRCPVCGTSPYFRYGLILADDCDTCGLHFERVEGHWLGSLGLSLIVSFTLLFFTLVVGAVITYPKIAVVPMIVVGLLVAILFPLLFSGTAKTLWTAIDISMRPLELGEVAPGWVLLGADDDPLVPDEEAADGTPLDQGDA